MQLKKEINHSKVRFKTDFFLVIGGTRYPGNIGYNRDLVPPPDKRTEFKSIRWTLEKTLKQNESYD